MKAKKTGTDSKKEGPKKKPAEQEKKLTGTDIRKKAMIAALEKSMGIVTSASKTAGISRQTHYEWMQEDEAYRKEVESLADLALDFAESKLMASISNGSDTATIFYLKTKGKKRGYIERKEITGEDGESLNTGFYALLMATSNENETNPG